MKSKLTKTVRELVIFALPISVGQVSHMLIGAGDVFVAARHSTQTVAAIGIANSIGGLIFMIGLGLLFGISPTLAKKRGESEEIKHYLYTCVAYSFVIALVFGSLNMLASNLVVHLGFDEKLVPLVSDYIFLVSFSYFGAYIFHAVKEYLQASERVVFANTVSLIAVPLNIGLNFMLVFGFLIFPELGVRGLAYATIATRTLMGLAVIIYAVRYDRADIKLIRHYVKHVFRFSVPISLSIFIEILAFSTMMILVGRLGPLQAAIHSIVLTLASTTFMIPLSISSAVSVKVSYFHARHDLERVISFIRASLVVSMSFMLFAGLCFFFFPRTILGIFTQDAQILLIGSSVLFVCALFQIFDGAQITLSGILRGFGITKPTFIVVTAGYWLLGIPLGYYLGVMNGMNVLGFWIGVAAALLIIAVLLFVYMELLIRRESLGIKLDKSM